MLSLRQYYLEKLAEECAEVAQRAMKQSQFGADEIQKDQSLTNKARLSGELNDLLVVMDILQDLGEVTVETDLEFVAYAETKRAKIQKYLKYSQSLGMVEND